MVYALPPHIPHIMDTKYVFVCLIILSPLTVDESTEYSII